MRLLGKVKNGNYTMVLFEDGTKIRMNDLDNLTPEYPESMDLKITNRCNKGCPFCHENSIPTGKHADIMNLKFIETLLPYTELAIGGGNPLEHPDLVPFLKKCKALRLIPNMTVNQTHFMESYDFIKQLIDEKLIYGLGVSLTDVNQGFLDRISKFPSAVIHIINGVHSLEELKKLYDKNLKLLVLGYKDFRRGVNNHNDIVDAQMKSMYDNLPELVNHFAVVSFDNLALKQLDCKRLLSEEDWNQSYLGSDGQFTLFIDAVEKTYSTSSTTPVEQRKPLLDDIKPMFDDIRGNK